MKSQAFVSAVSLSAGAFFTIAALAHDDAAKQVKAQ